MIIGKRPFCTRQKGRFLLEFGAINVDFAALKAATKLRLDGPSFTWMDQRLRLWTSPGAKGPWTQICRTSFPRDRAQQAMRFDPAENHKGSKTGIRGTLKIAGAHTFSPAGIYL